MGNDVRKTVWILVKRNVLLLALLLLIGGWYVVEVNRRVPPAAPEEQPAAAVLTAAEPLRIRIPAVAIDAPFEEPLGVDENREIEVPKSYDTVGWYKHGPTPGELGPAVVLGHVDSVEGPEVFYPLRDLKEGDEIFIERADGSTAVFVVTALQEHPQSGFPTQEVYGNIDHAGLRLITCSGSFDRGKARYSHNLIVFAKLKASL